MRWFSIHAKYTSFDVVVRLGWSQARFFFSLRRDETRLPMLFMHAPFRPFPPWGSMRAHATMNVAHLECTMTWANAHSVRSREIFSTVSITAIVLSVPCSLHHDATFFFITVCYPRGPNTRAYLLFLVHFLLRMFPSPALRRTLFSSNSTPYSPFTFATKYSLSL